MVSLQSRSPILGFQALSLSESFAKYPDFTSSGSHPSIDPNSSSKAILDASRPAPKTPSDKHYSEGEQQTMISTLKNVFLSANRPDGSIPVNEASLTTPEDTETGPDSSYSTRVEMLHGVRDILYQLWFADSSLVSEAAQVLADGARDSAWRKPYGDTGIVDFFLIVVNTEGVSYDLMLQSLRLLGNSCADVDMNRARVVAQDSTLPIIRQLHIPSLVHVAIPVLFNICVDYEPAQIQATGNGLVHALINLIFSESFLSSDQRNMTSYVCRLLEFATALPNGIGAAPENAVEVLLRLAADPYTELEDFVALNNLAATLLSDLRFQTILVAHCTVELPLSILVNSYSRIAATEELCRLNLESRTPAGVDRQSDAEAEKSLVQMRTVIIQVLSDISALPEFKSTYPLDSPLVGSLRLWLSASQSQLQVCACIVLGNLARSDEVCRTMVHDFHIHESLIGILEESRDTPIVHAAASFLKNLALMRDNKDTLGESGIVEIMSRLWSMDTVPQIQYAGASLGRQVISGSYDNIKRLLAPLSSDPDSPAHSRTYLSLLLSLCEKTDQVPIKMEVARSVTAIGRALSSTPTSESVAEVNDTLDRLYELHPDIAWPLVTMVCQSKWPVVRSEGWFTFALMAKTFKGSGAINDLLMDMEILRPLVETITGRQTVGWLEPSEASCGDEEPEADAGSNRQTETEKRKDEETRRIDRENALVLVSKLLEHRGTEMSDLRKQVFEDLLSGSDLDYVSFRQLSEQTTEKNASSSMGKFVPQHE
ncbi:MAG: hypothetical protein M1837_001776 [Sclerophora amabilis]|nr:MAG: hypothetical protein M1837_001776 [Sclerophora amabilis]